jgi:hypothetical protein
VATSATAPSAESFTPACAGMFSLSAGSGSVHVLEVMLDDFWQPVKEPVSHHVHLVALRQSEHDVANLHVSTQSPSS